MTEHPITPPPELVVKWIKSARYKEFMPYPEGYEQYAQRLTTIAARWGSDQELEACCKLLELSDSNAREFLTAARRPKPPSLKEQALMALEDGDIGPGASLTPVEVCIIRRALEQLDD